MAPDEDPAVLRTRSSGIPYLQFDETISPSLSLRPKTPSIAPESLSIDVSTVSLSIALRTSSFSFFISLSENPVVFSTCVPD